MPRSSSKRVKAVVAGFLGSLGLVLFYFLITVLITGNPQFPVNQFLAYKYLMTPLVIGFGIQIGLLVYLRSCGKNDLGAKISAGTSGGISGVSIVVGFGLKTPKQKIYEIKSAALGEITVEARPEKLGAGEGDFKNFSGWWPRKNI